MAHRANLPSGYRFNPTDRQIIGCYLIPMALHGEDSLTQKGDVVEGVDVFATRPDAIPFDPRHVLGRSVVRAYFFGDHPTDSRGREVPGGGAWLPCGGGGGEKAYSGGDGDETVAYRLKYEFRTAEEEETGGRRRGPRWRMKEFRLNKGAAAFRRAHARPNPKANLDCVVRVVYTKVDEDELEEEDDDYEPMDYEFEFEDFDDDQIVAEAAAEAH
uniref:NAC domain-containing protein n=1 Tax=Leersia perrieri TaxID=77586 RepID=A0A0D9W675_9ORYZ